MNTPKSVEERFVEFWDSKKETLNLGEYSDAVLHFWLDVLKDREEEMLKRLEEIRKPLDPDNMFGYNQANADAQTIIKEVMKG